jgi:hypothetical protein
VTEPDDDAMAGPPEHLSGLAGMDLVRRTAGFLKGSAVAATPASARRRAVSSSANTSSRISTGSLPSVRNNSYAASRSDSAIDHDSPWLAKPFAG